MPWYCDFHLHSDRSDGEFAPATVVDMAADAGVRALALTDHDTLDGCTQAESRARERGIAFVRGIEMTAYAAGHVIHILGLGVRERDPGLAIANEIANDAFGENQLRWIEALEAEGFEVSSGRDFPELPVRLPVLIRRLCEHGVDGGDPQRCHARFQQFFAALPADAYARLPSPAEAGAAIRGAGGVAILAHPARLDDDELAQRFLFDLDGIEALYAPYAPKERARLRAMAAAHGKMYSCGSDYHGFFNGAYINPKFEAPPALLAALSLA